jgi:hypothetical protein
MKTKIILIAALLFGTKLFSQTMFIDYTERTKENTATIHLIEAKLPIENEEFNDLSAAKVKLIRIIENYRKDGYEVKATSVSTHKAKGSLHYHYQYILQKTTRIEEFVNELDDAEGMNRPQMRKNQGGKIGQPNTEGDIAKPKQQIRRSTTDSPMKPQSQPKAVE